jgi:hypothetical protein
MSTTVGEAAAWVAIGFIGFLALTVVVLIGMRRIDLSHLISEPTGDASMSRFQLLVFTFVIALSFLLIVTSGAERPAFPPEIPTGVLTLLGISASSYLVSKGIQFSRPEGVEERAAAVTVRPDSVKVRPGQTAQIHALVERADDTTVEWSLVPPALGRIDQTGLYTAPPAAVAETTVVTVQARSVIDSAAVDVAHVILPAGGV